MRQIADCISSSVIYTNGTYDGSDLETRSGGERKIILSAASVPGTERPRPGALASWSSFTAGVFSFPVMCMFLLAAVILGFSVRQIAEPDIWWHLRNAQQLVLQHSFPKLDTYSFGATGAPWLSHEWLSEIPFFFGLKTKGLQGILGVYFAVLVLIYTGVYYRSCRAGANCKNAAVTTLLAIFLGVVSIGPRVLLFGWLCMVGLLVILDHFRLTGKGLWLLPSLFVLWINLHGSWVFGIAVLALTVASGLVAGEWGLVVARRWSPRELKRILLALGASVAVLFVNPFSYKLVLYPFDFLLRQPSNMKHIGEWQPVDFNTGDGKLALIVTLGLLAVTLLSRRRWRLDELLLTAFALWVGLSHTRFLFFAGLIIPPILAPHLNLFPPYERELDKPWLNAVIMAALVGSLFFFVPSPATLQQKVDEEYPRSALEFMQRQHIKGRIFNQYVWGGYMEWNAPELRPFTDGRADIFMYNGTFDDYISAMLINQPFEIMDKYAIDYALLDPKQPLTYLLEHSRTWRTIYSDKVAVLFERIRTTEEAATPSK